MSIWDKILDGSIVAATGLMIAGIAVFIRWLSSVGKSLQNVLDNQNVMSGMLCSLMAMKGGTLSVQRATLDILVGAKINGNVDKAYAELDKADAAYDAAIKKSLEAACSDGQK